MAEGVWEVQHRSDRMDWATPEKLFRLLNVEFEFGLDAAAQAQNTKCPLYISPQENALTLPIGEWKTRSAGEAIFLNPPYGRGVGAWIDRAWREAEVGATVVMLTFACTDTKWWKVAWERAYEIRFITGRVRFINPANGLPGAAAPKGSAILIFHGGGLRGQPRCKLMGTK